MLGGTGEVVFEAPYSQSLTGGLSRLFAQTGVLTIGSGVTVRSGAAGGRVGQAGASIASEGTISAEGIGRRAARGELV